MFLASSRCMTKAIALLALLFVSPLGAANNPSGWGYSKAPVEGEPLAIPSGLTIDQPFAGISIFDEDCLSQSEPQKRGSGGAVLICFSITNFTDRNGTPQVIPFVLPAGTTFISQDDEYQNGILVVTERFDVLPGQTIRVPLYLYCMNTDREQSTPASSYTLGPVTQLPAFKQLSRLIAAKKVPTTSGAISVAIGDIEAGRSALQPITLSLMEAEIANWPASS